MKNLLTIVACLFIGMVSNARAESSHDELTNVINNIFNPTPPTTITHNKRGKRARNEHSEISGGGDKATIVNAAVNMGISRAVIERVAKRESGFNCHAYNHKSGASGPLQILPSSARAILGYTPTGAALRSCGIGMTAGLTHLKLCVDKVGQNPSRAAYCHNYGLGSVTHRRQYASR